MQIKFKKTCLLTTIIVYCASFLLQSNFGLFEILAKDDSIPRVNVVAILVDNSIYNGIESNLKWYASDYVQGKLSDTKALVIPLNLSTISAYDIHRMMENIYFDGLKNVNSSLIGLVMVGDIPLPVVNQNGYVFPTVYPYVDFEDQKYIWDPESQYFVYNGNPGGQAEIWHGLINYGSDIGEYNKYFNKIKNFEGIGTGFWYEDFIASKEGFLNENFPYYRNKIMFGEDLSYQRYSPLMKKIFEGESIDNSVDIVKDLGDTVSSMGGNADEILDSVDYELINQLQGEGLQDFHSTKMVQQEIQDGFLSDYDELFSKVNLSTMRENVLAGGRWTKESKDELGQSSTLADVDSSVSMIQLKDTMYLGNDNLQGLFENLNELMENMVDKKINEEKYSRDIVIPVEYKKVTGKRVTFKCRSFVSRFENFYFGSNARYIDSAEDLTIYRGTYRNLNDLSGVTYLSLSSGSNPSISSFDKTDLKLKSIGGSYDIFSNQAEGNRGYSMLSVENDLDIYDENKTAKKSKKSSKTIFGRIRKRSRPEICKEDSNKEKEQCENLNEFAKRWWGGASAINLDEESVSQGRYELSGYIATDSWRSIFGMGGFQSLLPGNDEGSLGKGWVGGTGAGPQTAATSYKSYIKYSSPTEREGWRTFRWALIGKGYEIYENHTPDVHMNFDDINYWGLSNSILAGRKFSKQSARIFDISSSSSKRLLKCGGSEKYSYKVISSIVKHDSTTQEEINGIDKDRYGESGTLGIYYRDIKEAYQDLSGDLSDILDSFSGLISDINSGNVYMENKINELSGAGSQLSQLKAEISNLNGQISAWELQLNNLRLQLEMTEDEAQNESIQNSISLLENRISSGYDSLNIANRNRSGMESGISNILDDVRNFLFDDITGCEKTKLTDIYQLMVGLYSENIVNVMEYIIYLEGGDPENYYSTGSNSSDLIKIGFLQTWINDIKSIESSIKSNSRKIIPYYSEVYSGVLAQQSLWNGLASRLLEISDENEDKINSITLDFDNIFTLESSGDEEIEDDSLELEDEDEGDGNVDPDPTSITLTGGTATIEINNFNSNFNEVSSLFSKLVEVDRIGPAIVRAAQQDIDFRKWLTKNRVDISSDEEWIKQYAQWAKGAGYDSEGAKRNHDLLLGASEHMSGMNILTPDRPIDSPRYVSMQSVAGNEIKLIYPDLFKVEVFVLTGKNKSGYDIHELLTGGQIRENLVEYLSGKADEFNKILEIEYRKAKLMSSDIHSSRLKSLGFGLATEDVSSRPYNYFTYEDFEKALGGSGMITAISEMLYYQNLTNKRKFSTGSVNGDIELIKSSFNVNDKRGQTLKDYLTQGNEKKKNPLFEIPMYEPNGYEVAFVNSNGRDYIIPSEVSNVDAGYVKDTKVKVRRRQNTSQEDDYEDECNIPLNGRLPLFALNGTSVSSPWFIGFKCWLKKTKEEPFKIKLTFDHSIGDIIVSSGFNTFVKSLGKSLFSETSETLSDWGDSRTKYADARDTLIEGATGQDSDKNITQLQVDAEKHNQEISNNSELFGSLKISNSNELLSDNNPNSLLKIESTSDIGNVSVVFTSTGDGCIKIDDNNLCGGNSFRKVFNPKTASFSGLISSADHKAGKVGLDLKIYIGGSYIEKIIKYTVSPSTLSDFKIKVDDDKTIAGMISPVEIIGYDEYGNRVSWGLDAYDFTVTKGRFLKDGAYQTGFSTNDFRDLRFYYQAPLDAGDFDEGIIQISRKNGSGVEYVGEPYHQKIVQASPVIKVNDNVVIGGNNVLQGNISYKLKNDEDIYDGGKLNVSKLQKLNVEIRDSRGEIVDVDSQVLVTSQNGLVVVGVVQSNSGSLEFRETSKSYISGGFATLYYYPTTIAGEDKINIDIPGLDVRVINLSILPGSYSDLEVVLEKDVLDLGDEMYFEIFMSDKWGNRLSGINPMSIEYDENKVEILNPRGGRDGFVGPFGVYDGYFKGRIVGTGAGFTSLLFGGSKSVYLNIDKHLFPDSGLNVMYLNYFGDDWGNQRGYFSDHNKYIQKLMSKSKKVITTTTQLVSEDKIKKMVWKISPSFRIWNPDNVDTSLTLNGLKFDMTIGGITTMVSSLPSVNWVNVDNFDSIVENVSGKNKTKNGIFFVPSDVNYSVDRGVLYNSGIRVLDLSKGEATLQLTKSSLDNGDNVWTLIDKGINYGSIIIHCPNFVPRESDFAIPGDRYLVNSTFTDGSTYKLSSVGIFDFLSDFELNTNYKSIQNSDEVDEKIGFLGDFKNITLFAEGEIVGEATRKFGSEFVINLGDPVLSKVSKNENIYGTKFDGGIGEEIYSDSESDIFGTYQIDFDNDGRKDLIVVYLDGTIKLAKSYGGSPDLRNMQELMRIAVPIQDVFVGDVDGNSYEDILIRTDNNQLRAYTNQDGIFDVDGSVACLNQNVFEGEISSTPSSLDGIYQFFVEDMDQDGKVDVITYDSKGYIKVFYGGSTNGGPNYLSKNIYSCDSGWYDREIRNTTIVAALGLKVTSAPVYDNSMLRWVGMARPEIEITEDELPEYGIYFDPNSLERLVSSKKRNQDGSIDALVHEVMDGDINSSGYNFDVSEGSQKFIDEAAKFVDVTLYENTLVGGGSGKNYVFAPISYLDISNPDDYAMASKSYRLKSGHTILQNGDIVTVSVTIYASPNHDFIGSFGDIIQGPRNLHYDQNKIPKGIRFTVSPGNAVFKGKDGNFSYIVDNIHLSAGSSMQFQYDLEYKNIPLRKMDITYKTFYSDDLLPDIKLQSVDGCSKDFDVYENGGRSFSERKIPLQNMIDETYSSEDEKTVDYAQDVVNAGSDVNQLPGIVQDSLYRISLLKGASMTIGDDSEGRNDLKNELLRKIQEGGLEALNIDLNIDLSIFEEQAEKVERIVDDITKGMCNGFSFGGSSNCKGLPVPFNQAFLAPGKYHLFGCWDLPLGKLEGGLPVFFFPGTLRLPFGDIPIPWGMKGAGDGFIWIPGGSWQSMIRIYAAPTLTAQLGIAVCMGPYSVGAALKSPFSDIGGNCVVFAVKPQCKHNDGEMTDLNNPNQTYVDFVEEVKDSGICLQSQKGPQVTLKGNLSSPFEQYSYRTKYSVINDKASGNNSWKNFDWKDSINVINLRTVDLNGGSHNDLEFSADFLGLINLETSAYVAADDAQVTKNSIMIGDVDVLGGDFDVNKIKGGIQQGVRKLLIDKWLDPQIRYIVNQLTKMHVNVKLPDFSNLIDNEIQTLQDVSDNMGDLLSQEKVAIEPDFLSDFSTITYDNLMDYNKGISNPFETLAVMLNQSNIINVSTELLTVKVPIITSDEINAYEFYLHQWIQTNSKIVEERKTLLNSMGASCNKEDTEEKKQACLEEARKNLEAFVEFENVDWQKMLNQIYSNLAILQQYRNFPFEIYEWIHVIDRYMSEIASLINNTMGYLSYWTVTNSERFVGYIDAIVLILNIIKTYQLIINFSVEWSKNCGNCAKDTYDQYSCKLSLLCDSIQLPIIQIPNFKLPNVTIDLTNMDLSLDVILPEFNFQPIKVNLPDLPNLPKPPSVGLNIRLFDLPNIPLLPQPPTLPELPSFIPEVELELPILPPAPELPKLPDKIEGIIKIANLIGKIYCIVKGQFGLVGEKSVKAKIEQLTQRTYKVDWIDNLMNFTNWSVAPVKNYGVDYEIDSYVDLQFDFSAFYDYLDILTKGINNLSTSIEKGLNEDVIGGINEKLMENPLINVRDSIDGANVQINAKITKVDDSQSQNIDLNGYTSDEIEYVDYNSAKSRLQEVLSFFRGEAIKTTLVDSIGGDISKIENQVDKPTLIIANTGGIENVKNEVIDYIENKQVSYDDVATLINDDYDSFLAMVETSSDKGLLTGDGKLLTFSTNLFNLDPSTRETINFISGANPYQSLLDNKKEIVDGYRNAINNNTADDLGLSSSQYLVLRDNISSLKNQVSTLYSMSAPISSTKLMSKNGGLVDKSLVAGNRIGSNMKVAEVIDPSVLSDGIYEKMIEGPETGKLVKVVNSDSFVTDIGDKYYKTSHDDEHNIILWDENSVYIKCFDQMCNAGGSNRRFNDYYSVKALTEIPYKETRIKFSSDTVLKIADENQEVKGWNVVGQSYDTLSFSWSLDDIDAYLIKLVERIDYSYEKAEYTKNKRIRYILALPDGIDLDDSFKLELIDNSKKSIKSLLNNGDLAQIVYYNSHKDLANVIISNLDRKWYYGRVATLTFDGKDEYLITSPRSNQIVAGKQVVGDDFPPLADQTLFRISTSEEVSQGDDLEGFVGTKYLLNVKWKDNVALSYINISKNGRILAEKYTSSPEDLLSVNVGMHYKSEKEYYDLLGIDQFGNKTEKAVTVSYYIPDITLTNVSKNNDGETVSITAELSQDLDQGNVSFQRRRGTVRKTMKKKYSDCADLAIGPGDTTIVGSGYSVGNDIAMYDKNDEIIALMNPKTGEIRFQSGYVDNFGIKVSVKNSAVLNIYDKNSNETKFSVSLPTKKCVKIEAESYSDVSLPENGRMGMFNGGQAVYKDGNIVLLVSPTCHLYSELGLEGSYSYDSDNNAILLTLYQSSDLDKLYPIKVLLEINPFVAR